VINKLRTKVNRHQMLHIDDELTELLEDEWTDETKYFQAIEREILIYQEIKSLIEQISENREKAKMRLLESKWSNGDSIIAFDSTIISICYFEWMLLKVFNVPEENVIVAVGSNKNLQKLELAFGLKSTDKNNIGLFSDALSEGIDLQGSQNLVLLDLPSVMRLAEQRIGRIDRLNSPYEFVNIYWPKDHEAYTLKTDKRFFDTVNNVEATIGGNIRIPIDLNQKAELKIDIDKYQELLQQTMSDPKFEILDAFSSVRALYLGSEALISEKYINEMDEVNASVLCNVSYLESKKPWAFYCIKGEGTQSTYWVLQKKKLSKSEFITDLDVISKELRILLQESVDIQKINSQQQREAGQFLLDLKKQKQSILSVAQKRGIAIFSEHIQNRIAQINYNYPISFKHDSEMITSDNLNKKEIIKELEISLDATRNDQLDLVPFASEIVKVFKKRLISLKKLKSNKNKVWVMNDLKKELLTSPLSIDEIKSINQYSNNHYNIENHISAAIFALVPLSENA